MRVNFEQSFDEAPVVFPQVVTVNEASAVTIRVANVTKDGFDMALQEQQGANGVHAPETVHWVAVEAGATTTKDGKRWLVGTTGTAVNHNFSDINFPESIANPSFISAMQTTQGGDAAALRYINLTSDNVQVRVEEERAGDNEVLHVRESVGYLVVGVPR